MTLGFDNRIELALSDGERVWAQLDPGRGGAHPTGDRPVVGVDLSQSRRPGWEPGGYEPARPEPVPGAVIPLRSEDERGWRRDAAG